MKDLHPRDFYRLFGYARRYTPALLASVFFMAIVGLSQGLLVKLIPLVFERVLKPNTPDERAKLIEIPHTHFIVYLNDLVPSFVHNIWTM
ncbi:MAG: ABC transporter ATP-binding protein, partial [Bryobacteraceae bacterium]